MPDLWKDQPVECRLKRHCTGSWITIIAPVPPWVRDLAKPDSYLRGYFDKSLPGWQLMEYEDYPRLQAD